MIIDLHWNKEFAKEREGVVLMKNGNHKLYKCPANKWTIAHGYNIEEHGLPDHMARELLNTVMIDTQTQCRTAFPFWDCLDAVRKSVVVDMVYNMGLPTLRKFKKFLAAIECNDYAEAAIQMQDSKWYKQVGERAVILQEMMHTGKYPS